tara:strand:+ start:894 stop:1700 length:807 start_codon:yes stop_codon:yes gene_type:complete
MSEGKECCLTDINEISHIDKRFDKIQSIINSLPEEEQDKIKLLKNKDVISWIFGHTKFFEPENPVVSYGNKYIQVDTGEVYKSGKRKGQRKMKKKKYEDKNKPKYKYNKGQIKEKRRENEAEWNMKLMKEIRPDLFKKEHSQSSLFGLFGEILVKEYYILIGEFKSDKPDKKAGHDLDLETIKEMIEVKTGSYFTTGTAGEKIYGVPYKYSEVPDLYGKPLLIILIGGDKNDSSLVCESSPKKEKMKKIWKEEFNITFICFKSLLDNL